MFLLVDKCCHNVERKRELIRSEQERVCTATSRRPDNAPQLARLQPRTAAMVGLYLDGSTAESTFCPAGRN